MRIKEFIWQHRRDFEAWFVCPSLQPKYPEGYQI
nr:MAG TPA: hypothetical protein [Caudoviricetes sp.]